MRIIGQDEKIKDVGALINILNTNDKINEAQQIQMLLEQMHEMEKNYVSVLQELASVKVKLNNIQLGNLSQAPVRDNIIQMQVNVDEASHDIAEKHHNMQKIKENLNTGAKHVVQKFKDIGITALNNVCEFLGVKEKTIKLRDDARSNEMKMKTSIEKIEKIEAEFGATVLHTKNIGRAITGKETLTETNGKKSKFFDLLKKPYLKHQTKWAKQCEKLNRKIEKFDSLEKAAGNIKKNRDSVRDKLSDNKKIVEFRNEERNDVQKEKGEMQRDACER